MQEYNLNKGIPEFRGLPVAGHELFAAVWDHYAESYNVLADTLTKGQVELLRKTLRAAKNLERLCMLHYLEVGANHITGKGDLDKGGLIA